MGNITVTAVVYSHWRGAIEKILRILNRGPAVLFSNVNDNCAEHVLFSHLPVLLLPSLSPTEK